MRVRNKFERLVRSAKLPGVHLKNVPSGLDLQEWSEKFMPGVVREMEYLEWNMSSEDTWLECTFISSILKWDNINIALFITDSYADYIHAKRFLNSTVHASFRSKFNLSYHASLLLHPYSFIEEHELYDIKSCVDAAKGWGLLDLSHVNDEDDRISTSEWSFLDNEEDEDEWTAEQVSKIYNREYH